MTKSSPISSTIESILRSIRDLPDPIRVQGASASASAWLLSRWARELAQNETVPQSTLVVLCRDDDSAAELAADMETLSDQLLGWPIKINHFPFWDQSLYSPIAPSLRVRLARIATLTALHSGRPPHVVVTTLAAAAQASIPREEILRRTTLLRQDQAVESREHLAKALLEAGYLRVDTVEDPGTFALRGDIIDVFPPDREKPVRVELFGDLIEKIREFDSGTQRAGTTVFPQISVPPAREVLINNDTLTLLRERLKGCADDAGVHRTVRDPILAQVQDGMYPEHSDAWAAFAYSKAEPLWEHLTSAFPIVFNDELSCLQDWDEFIENQDRLAEEAPGAGVIVPPVAQLFPSAETIVERFRSKTRLYLDRVALTDLASEPEGPAPEGAPQDEDQARTRHRVFVKSNADLASGSRHSLGELAPKFRLWLDQGFRVFALASTQSQAERVRFLLEERKLTCLAADAKVIGQSNQEQATGAIHIGNGSLSEGFRWPAEGLVILLESEILGSRHARKPRRPSKAESGSAAKDWSGLQALSDLGVGDAVVHVDHGIGRYLGLVRLDLSGAPSDFLLLEYANKDKLYLPVYRLNAIQKYVGSGDSVVLDRLGTAHFTKAKERVKDAVKKLAFDLVKLYAERRIRPGVRFSPRDSAFSEFEAKFPYDETPDQLTAINAVMKDLELGKVMDRLVCGDVGYGKTEVAIRAAFRAVSDGKQVAVLVPTTILAQQHEETFKSRLKDYPIIVEALSRFRSPKSQKEIIAGLAGGKVDIVIGTHRLLSKDIKFQDLGLIIVDEEHRFGVEHKERLKTLKTNTHVLTLTATPIPRTLHMALSGIRDISIINTPPVDRLPIRTYVSKFDEALIKRAIDFELNRGGQVFFLHNRVMTIYETANRLRQIAPQASVVVGHGQMSEHELETTMRSFYKKEANVLVCTSIIESGLDLPSANTIIIDRADALGLAQLYQIRGRVGRGQQRAYAYLMLPAEGSITEEAKKRLEVIQRFVELGSGFSVASHDLEIRGGGDLLGPQQSGQIAAVGFDLYTELLEEAIHELQGQPLAPEESRQEPEIKAPFAAFLGEDFVPDVHQRLSLYRRFSAARSEGELLALEEELRDRFGPLPQEAQNLLWMIRIKQLLKQLGVESLTVGPERVALVSGKSSRLDPTRAIALVSAHPHEYQITPDSKFVARIPTGSLRDVFFGMEKLFQSLTASGVGRQVPTR